MTSLRWLAADTWTIALRTLTHWRTRPGTLAMGLLFPVLVLLMFAYLFGGALTVPGGGDYEDFLLPGMFGLSVLFGIEATMTAVVTDKARGVVDRFRALPMSGPAIVTGRGTADLLYTTASVLVLVVAGRIVGWDWDRGLGNALLAIGLLLWLAFAFAWIGIFLGLVAQAPESVAAVQILVWPVGMLSSAFVAPSTMPGWLGAIAEASPVSATVTATRDLFGNPGVGGETWFADHATLLALVWPLVLTAVFLPLAVRRYRALGG